MDIDEDDDIQYVKKARTIHYGSLEEQERKRTKKDEEELVQSVGHVNISDEYMDLEDEMAKDKQALLDEFERKKKARQINVSTDDTEVKKNLRDLGEPICYFSEGPAERRIRLRNLLSSLGEDAIQRRQEEEEERIQQEKEQEATWYHEGPRELRDARFWIAKYSLHKAKLRLAAAREEINPTQSMISARKQELQKYFGGLSIMCSQIGDSRPVSHCSFSADSKLIATASWTGNCKVWSVPDCEPVVTYKAHDAYVSAVMFHPHAPNAYQKQVCDLASCAADGTVKLWSLHSEQPIAHIRGHEPNRVSKVAFHPSGRFLGTCCYDNSWRLWDLNQMTEVLHQEGHCKPVHCMSFQCDGSVVATGGLDSFGRVWDLRTGRCVMFMEGHLKSIYAIDFSPNGYHIATGSEDNTARIWDLRKRKSLYTIPAHLNLISTIKYQPSNGQYLITAGYDNTAKVWLDKTWQPLKTLSGHDGKVMCMDISPDCKYIATSSYDRTFKLWAPE